MTSNYTFIYDGECPFCNHFAELLEIKSKLNNIKILDGRKNLTLIKSLLDKGYDLDKGAILLKDEDIFHGADAINTICKQINNPSSSLLLLLSRVFKSNKRTNIIFPLLVRARRLARLVRLSISLPPFVRTFGSLRYKRRCRHVSLAWLQVRSSHRRSSPHRK